MLWLRYRHILQLWVNGCDGIQSWIWKYKVFVLMRWWEGMQSENWESKTVCSPWKQSTKTKEITVVKSQITRSRFSPMRQDCEYLQMLTPQWVNGVELERSWKASNPWHLRSGIHLSKGRSISDFMSLKRPSTSRWTAYSVSPAMGNELENYNHVKIQNAFCCVVTSFHR